MEPRCPHCPHGPTAQPEGCIGQWAIPRTYCELAAADTAWAIPIILGWKPMLPTHTVVSHGSEPPRATPSETPVEVATFRPSVSEARAKLARVAACPHWTKATDCGCAKNYCGLGRGDRGRVDYKDCFACLGMTE